MSSSSTLAASTSVTASAAATSTAAAFAATDQPPAFKAIGAGLAVLSGVMIGCSFVLKKKGLIAATAKSGHVAGEGHSYLKSWLWWSGMTLMIIGELLNLAAFSFASPTLVTPLGAITVVVSAVMSSIFLKETLSFFGKLGVALCLLGAAIVGMNASDTGAPPTILAFRAIFLAPGFLAWSGIVVVPSLVLIFYAAPRYGKTHMLVYISICSLIGGLSVACTQGLGASILTSIRGENQFKEWFIYVLIAIVVVTLLTELNYLNKALELFNSSMVVPTYFVTFTSATLISSIILAQGFDGPIVQLLSLISGFFVIVLGITLLQLSKVDPKVLSESGPLGLDRRSTILLNASRSMSHHDSDAEKGTELEDPGIDALRGGFGAIGSIHRAISSRKSLSSRNRNMEEGGVRRRKTEESSTTNDGYGLTTVRHQLYDAPMPLDASDKVSMYSSSNGPPSPNPYLPEGGRRRATTLSFAVEDDIAHDHRSRNDQLDSRFSEDYEDESGRKLPGRSGGGGPNFASMLSSHFAPSISSNDSSSLPSANAGKRFHIPGFPRRSDVPSGAGGISHRDGRIKGPIDLDDVESRSLVRDEPGSWKEEEERDEEDPEERAEREELEREFQSRLPSRE